MTKYYIVYNSSGEIVTRYDSSINGNQINNPPIGTSLLEVSLTDFQNTFNGGYTVVNNTLVPPPAAEPLTSAQLIENAIITQTQTLSSECFNFITNNGLPVEIGGALYMIGANQIDQNNLNTMSVTNLGIANSPLWTADTVVEAGSTVVLNGTYLITKTGGTTGSTEPTAPTEFQVPITDGGVTWYLYGNYVALAGGGAMWITLQQFRAAYAQGVAYLTDMRAEYHALVASMSGMTLEQVKAVVWPFTTVADALSYVGYGTTSTTSTSAQTASS